MESIRSISRFNTNSDGLTYSNTITMSGNCNTFNGCGYQTSPTNTIIITNPASDYDITARFDFSVPAQNNDNHYAADVKDPNLVVNYEPFSIDLSTTNDLSLWLDDFEESFTQEFSEPDFFIMEDIFEEEELLFNEYFIFEEPSVIFLPEEPTELPEIMFMEEDSIFFSEEMFIEEPMSMEEMRDEIISEIETMMPEMSEEMVDELIEEIIEEMPEEPEVIEEIIEEEIITEEEPDLEEIESITEESESQVETKFVELDIKDTIATITLTGLDLVVKIDQLFFDEMVKSQPVLQDSNFYDNVVLYPDQISYTDSRDIYPNVVYVANDPLTKYNNSIQENQKQTFKLQYKLRNMKWMD